MFQKQKTVDPNDPKKDQAAKLTDDKSLKTATDKAKDVLADLDKAVKKKRGHWESCCGVRYWAED